MTENFSLYAEQYLTQAQATALAYIARTLPLHASPNQLRSAIKEYSGWSKIFTSQEIDSFSSTYEIVGSQYQGIDQLGIPNPGLDAVSFRRIGTNEILLGFSGVNSPGDLGQTGYGTATDTFKRSMVYQGIDFYRSIAAQYPDAIFDLAGHSEKSGDTIHI